MRESDIICEGSKYWVGRDRQHKAYVVYKKGPYYSTSDSAYEMNEDGLSIALARAKYLEALK
jgi:hypothetical protein